MPDDFEKINDNIEFVFKRFPVLEAARVKSVIYGAITVEPDRNSLVGPVPRIRNYWSACYVMADFCCGEALA